MSEISDDELLENLQKIFKHTSFKSTTQKNAIKNILKKNGDTYVSMPTGSGKSLCFHLPGAMQDNQITIVFEPLLSLMKNQLDYLHSLKIPAETLNSQTSASDRNRIIGDLKAKKTSTKFLYITPEQAATNFFKELLSTLVKFNKVAFIAVDEAHCVSQWGHDFRKDYLKLGFLRKEYPNVQWIALTATAPLKVKEDLIKKLALKTPASFQISCFRSNLYYDVAFKNLMQDDFIELKAYIEKCLAHDKGEVLKPQDIACGIIYCRKKDTTESVAKSLRKLGLACAAFHSGLKKSEKEQIQNDWMNGKCAVIVATVSFGMGIDKGPVRFVVHWDLPQSTSEWYQESGRAGRDNKYSFCRCYYDRDEVKSISFLLNREISFSKDKNSDQLEIAKQAFKEFQKISDHCESTNCRHKFFTNFFGDAPPNCKEMCDACKNKTKAKKDLEKFQMVTARASLGGFNQMPDVDPVNLYEGGRQGKTGSFEDYENDSGESSGFRKASDILDKRAEKSFIEKQFALRKAQAAEAIEMMPTSQISRVRAAQSTGSRIGLTLPVRETSLTHLTDTLKANMEKCEKANPPETPLHKLVYKDLEDIAKEIEYGCFSNCKAISVYRMKISKALVEIKGKVGLHPSIQNHVPAKRQAFGGDYKTVVSLAKERYGDDVVKELEDEKTKKIERVKKDKFKQSGRDGLNQTRINSFFSKNPNRSPDASSDDDVVTIEMKDEPVVIAGSSSEGSDSEEMVKLKLIKQVLQKELEKTAEEVEEVEKEAFNPEVFKIAAAEEEVDDKDVDSDDRLVIAESPIDKADCFPTAPPVKRKMHSIPLSNGSVKGSVLQHQSKKPRIDPPAKIPGEPKIHLKETIAKLVLAELNPFYKEKKFESDDPKSLFKSMARELTHHFFESSKKKVPSKSDIHIYVNEIFYNKGIIRCTDDFKTNIAT